MSPVYGTENAAYGAATGSNGATAREYGVLGAARPSSGFMDRE